MNTFPIVSNSQQLLFKTLVYQKNDQFLNASQFGLCFRNWTSHNLILTYKEREGNCTLWWKNEVFSIYQFPEMSMEVISIEKKIQKEQKARFSMCPHRVWISSYASFRKWPRIHHYLYLTFIQCTEVTLFLAQRVYKPTVVCLLVF